MAEDLWNEAVKTLSDEDRRNIAFSGRDKLDILGDVLKEAEKRKEECLKKRWRFKRSNGDDVILRDLFEKIVTWVNKFREIGDIAMQYDPGHAALPWAGIRFLLQIVVNDSQNFGTLFEGMEVVSHEITRCAIVEALHLNLRKVGQATVELRQALIKLYAAILHYLSQAKIYYEQNTAKRVLKSGFQLPEQHSLNEVKMEQANVDRSMHLVAVQISNDVEHEVALVGDKINILRTFLQDLEKPIIRSGIQLQDLHDDLKRQQRRDIIKWVSTIPHLQHHQNIRRDRLADSGSWLLEKPAFVEWRKSSIPSILWLRGIPGSGKSRLVSRVIDQLMEEGVPAPAFFYCTRNPAEPQRADPEEVLRSIIRQLACPEAGLAIRKPVIDKYDELQDKGEERKLTMDESMTLALQLTDENPTIIIIDALDECNPTRRHELFKALETLIKESLNLVKVFVSSRDDGDIVCRFRGTSNLCIHAKDNFQDIQRFVNREVEQSINDGRLLHGKVSNNLKQAVVEKLIEGAQGMFRWVSLQIENLCDSQRFEFEDDVRDELGRLPKELEDIYAVIYEQLVGAAPKTRSLAIRTLQWLLSVQTPLSPAVFIEAISVDAEVQSTNVSTENVLSICRNLVVLDLELDVFRFAHLSVREFLEKRPEYDIHRAHALAAKACIQRLLVMCNEGQIYEEHSDVEADGFEEQSDEEQSDEEQSDQEQSDQEQSDQEQSDEEHCIQDHPAVEAEDGEQTDEKQDDEEQHLVLDLNKDSSSDPALPAGSATASISDPHSKQTAETNTGDHSNSDTEGFSTSDPNEARLDFGDYAILYWATHCEGCGRSEREGMLSTLLAHFGLFTWEAAAPFRAWISVVDQKRLELLQYMEPLWDRLEEIRSRPVTPFFTACVFGFEEVIETLRIDNINLQNDHRNTGLTIASRNGQLDMVATLLSKGADVDAKYMKGWTPLRYAALYGHEPVVQLLLNNKADIEARLNQGWTPLHQAAWNGHGTVVQLLLNNKADTEARDDNGWTPLQLTAGKGYKTVVRLLLDNKANIGARDNDGWTPLHHAAWQGNEAVVQLLLDNKADIDAKTDGGWTLLHVAADEACEGVVKTLLSYGANINAEAAGRTPLYMAVRWGKITTARLLLDAGADVNGVTLTALTMDTADWRSLIPLLLKMLKRCKDINACHPTSGETALQRACEIGNKRWIKALIEAGADINMETNGLTLLYYAVLYGHNTTAQLLLDAGADVNGITLTALSKKTCRTLGPLLLERCKDVNACDPMSRETALQKAREIGDEAWINALIQAGANINAETDGFTPLYTALYKRRTATAQLLLDAGADVNGVTLTALSKKTCRTLGALLLERCKDVNACHPTSRKTALQRACEIGNKRWINALIQAGANVNAETDGFTSLYTALYRERTATAQLLLDAGAYINGVTLTALDEDTCRTLGPLLLERCKDINACNPSSGKTALLRAYEIGDETWINTLIQAGAT